jgi:predicted esterase
MATVKHISAVKTARYYTLGNLNAETKNIWMVLHGYGMRAEDFIKPFENIIAENDYVIAPEALSRFYAKGLLGPVGASWMTKEDRENDIANNMAYLSSIYENDIKPFHKQAQIHLLGFSQGATTMARFVSFQQPIFQKLWVCAGEIPEDVNWQQFKKLTDGGKLHIQLGKQDPLITPEHLTKLQERLEGKDIDYTIHQFDGLHEVNYTLLKN